MIWNSLLNAISEVANILPWRLHEENSRLTHIVRVTEIASNARRLIESKVNPFLSAGNLSDEISFLHNTRYKDLADAQFSIGEHIQRSAANYDAIRRDVIEKTIDMLSYAISIFDNDEAFCSQANHLLSQLQPVSKRSNPSKILSQPAGMR